MNIQDSRFQNKADVEEVLLVGGTQSSSWKITKWLVVILLLILVAPVVLQKGGAGNGQSMQYKTTAVSRGDIKVTVTATGTVQPTNDIDISSELSGKVVKVNVDYNDDVRVGQILAELSTDKLKGEVAHTKAVLLVNKAKVAEAKATLFETKKEFLRLSRLANRNLTADKELDVGRAAYERSLALLKSAEAEIRVAEADLNLKKILLDKAFIRSSINGIVLQRNVEPGQIVASTLQTPILFVLAEDIRQMQLEVDIDEADIGAVREGQTGYFHVDAYTDHKFPAVIKELRYAPEIVEGVVTYRSQEKDFGKV
jgi:HlyD family secretion protein